MWMWSAISNWRFSSFLSRSTHLSKLPGSLSKSSALQHNPVFLKRESFVILRLIMVHLITAKVDRKKILEMLEFLDDYIKVAVDINEGVLAGGGIMHADCETILLQNGSKQENIWGADWHPQAKRVEFQSLINIRPRQNNRSMEIQDQKIRQKLEGIVRSLLEI